MKYWFMVQMWLEENNMKNKEYKKLSIAEFTKAAGRYESNHAGIYEMCKKDYPDILEELEKEPFRDLLDAGCGPAPMISLLACLLYTSPSPRDCS